MNGGADKASYCTNTWEQGEERRYIILRSTFYDIA